MSVKNGTTNGLGEEKESKAPAFDPNGYATIKTISGGLIDVALLTSNALNIKYLAQQDPTQNQLHYASLSLLVISIIVQVIISILCGLVGFININNEAGQKEATSLNKAMLGLSVLATVVNILVATFSNGSDG